MKTILEAALGSGMHPESIKRAIREKRLPGATKTDGKWYVPDDFTVEQPIHPRKLTSQQREELRQLTKGSISGAELARRYGVSQAYVSKIKSGAR